MNCRSCSASSLELVLDLGMQPWGNDFIPISENRESLKYPLQLYFCHACSMVQIGYTVPKEIMFTDHNYMSGTTRSLTLHFQKVAEEIVARTTFGAGQYVLDIGGNDGTFLKSFVARGIKVINVDSGRKQAERSQANGVFCINTFFDEYSAAKILEEHGQAKVLHGSGILFHLESLHSAFDGIRQLMAGNGFLVAEFIYLPDMARNCAFDQIYHEHLLYYSLNTFSRLLARHGLEVHDCSFSPIHGGSCIAFIGHRGTRAPTSFLKSCLAKETEEGFDSIGVYRRFATRAFQLRERARAMVSEIRASGKTIQTLGAPVKGSTIVNFCGWTADDIQCATEVNELKCGTFIPGTKIPVVHQSHSKPPDVYLLLSWNFKDEILSHLDEFRRAGGKILIPIPEPVLI